MTRLDYRAFLLGQERSTNSRKAGLLLRPLLDRESCHSNATARLEAAFLGNFGLCGEGLLDSSQRQNETLANLIEQQRDELQISGRC